MSKDQKIVTKEEAQRWDSISTTLQLVSILALFPTMFILNSMPKAEARAAVWWFVIPIAMLGTIAFILSNISTKKMTAHLRQNFEEMQTRHAKIIEKMK